MNKVAIRTENGVEVHAKGDGKYTSLCGLAGDDPPDLVVVPVPRGARIDCSQCRAMWDAWRRFTRQDFA